MKQILMGKGLRSSKNLLPYLENSNHVNYLELNKDFSGISEKYYYDYFIGRKWIKLWGKRK
jgi:hypothetical protein